VSPRYTLRLGRLPLAPVPVPTRVFLVESADATADLATLATSPVRWLP
jgi:hypothetical protein